LGGFDGGVHGGGKSTTIKMLTGLLAPTSGAMHILGEDLSDPRRAARIKRRIGVGCRESGAVRHLTAREHLTFIGRMYLLPRDTIRALCEELLAMMDLAGEERNSPWIFAGMKRSSLWPPR